MKKIIGLFVLCLAFVACGTSQKIVTPEQFQAMTQADLEAGYDTVFSSTLSVLQGQGFLISNTDKASGLISASKRIENKYNFWSDLFLGGYVKAKTAMASFLLRPLNDSHTEVKLTVYAGDEVVLTDNNQRNLEKSSSIVKNPATYQMWFSHLRQEVDRRKGRVPEVMADSITPADSIHK